MANHTCNKGWILVPNDDGDVVPFFVQVRGEDVIEVIDDSLAMKLQQDTGIAPLDYKLIGGKVFTTIDNWDCEFSNSMSQASGGKSIAELRTYRRMCDIISAGNFALDGSRQHATVEVPIPIPFFATNILVNMTASLPAVDWMKCIVTPEATLLWGDNTKYISLTGDNQKVKLHIFFNTSISDEVYSVENCRNTNVGISINLCGHYVII